MSIHAIVQDVVDETVYDGNVYEYRVVFESEGFEFGLLDPDMVASPEDVGHEYELEIAPFIVSRVEIAAEEGAGILPNPGDPRGWNHHTFIGDVMAVSTGSPPAVEINVGGGTVGVDLDTDTLEFPVERIEAGLQLPITTVRTDLHDVDRDAGPETLRSHGHGASLVPGRTHVSPTLE